VGNASNVSGACQSVMDSLHQEINA
jgi:hypothetical protein